MAEAILWMVCSSHVNAYQGCSARREPPVWLAGRETDINRMRSSFMKTRILFPFPRLSPSHNIQPEGTSLIAPDTRGGKICHLGANTALLEFPYIENLGLQIGIYTHWILIALCSARQDATD